MSEQRIHSRRAAAQSGRKKLRRTVSIIRGFSMHDSGWTMPNYELPRELACEDADDSEPAWTCLEAEGLAEHNRLRRLHRARPLRLSRPLCQMAAALAEAAAAGGQFQHSDRQLRLFHRGVHAGEAIAYRVATCWAGAGVARLLTGPEATRMWYTECSDPGYSFEVAQPQDGTGHFTQLVWRASRLLGIASATMVTTRSAQQQQQQQRRESSSDLDDEQPSRSLAADEDCPAIVTNVIVALYFPPGNVEKCFEDNVLPAAAPGEVVVDDPESQLPEPASGSIIVPSNGMAEPVMG